MEEVWKDIPGYEGMYQISNTGRVKSLSRERKCNRNSVATVKERIKPHFVNKKGYCQIGLCKNGKRTGFHVHRLVAMAFIPNPYNKKTVNHIDGNKSNNNVENLEWATYSENIKHAFLNNLIDNSHSYDERKKPIVQMDKESGELLNTYDSIGSAMRSIGKNTKNAIISCCKGRIKTAYGFCWLYKNDYDSRIKERNDKLCQMK